MFKNFFKKTVVGLFCICAIVFVSQGAKALDFTVRFEDDVRWHTAVSPLSPPAIFGQISYNNLPSATIEEMIPQIIDAIYSARRKEGN